MFLCGLDVLDSERTGFTAGAGRMLDSLRYLSCTAIRNSAGVVADASRCLFFVTHWLCIQHQQVLLRMSTGADRCLCFFFLQKHFALFLYMS